MSATPAGGGGRAAALALLGRIRRERSFANLVLASSGDLARLSERDRAFATRLVYGTLQMEGSLDAALGRVADRGRLKVPPDIRDVLRLGAYQLLFTDVPAHAAVAATVSLVRKAPAQRWRGTVNALLRSLAAEGAGFPWVERGSDPAGWLSLVHGHPRWLVERLVAAYGEARAEALLAADNIPAPTHLRVNTLKTTRPATIRLLAARGYEVAAARRGFPSGVVVAGPPGVWREPEAGILYLTQDIGSQMAPQLLGPRPGERVLDAACGRGGKTTHLAALMRDQGEVVAVDVSPAKVRQAADLAGAMGASIVRAVTADARDPRDAQAAGAGGLFDAVLLDAPCSGSGTLRRRAELRWRMTPEDLERVMELQRELLATAALRVRPGGRLVYSTCSVLPEENLQQIQAALGGERRAGARVRFRLTEDRQLLPDSDGADGHFAALLARVD